MPEIKIFLENKYFPWNYNNLDENEIWFKGSFFIKDRYVPPSEIPGLLLNLIGLEDKKICDFLQNLNGNYSFVLKTPEYLYAVGDRIRSIPVLYSVINGCIHISDDPDFLSNALSLSYNEDNFAEFLVTGFVTGKETLFNEIFSLQAGEYLVSDLKKGIFKTESYFNFYHTLTHSNDENTLLEILDRIYIDSFKRLIESVKREGKIIVVPLSSGLDSRIIVSMLKDLGVDDVICFSYGWLKSREAVISRQVAEKLGYEWHFVDYSSGLLYDSYHSDEMISYLKYAGNFVSLPYIQDFAAVNILKKEGRIPENSCIVPGHTGMISGGRIPNSYASGGIFNKKRFLRDNILWHYNLWKWSGEDDLNLKEIFEKKCLKSINYSEISDRDTCASAIELFDYKERQAKYVINSLRLYEYFGFSWKLPLVDSEVLDFFLRVPLDLRIGRGLYKKYAQQILFKRSVSGFFEIECTTDLSQRDKREELDLNFVEKIKKYNLLKRSMSKFIVYCIFKRPFFSEIKLRVLGINADDLNQKYFGIIIKNNNKACISKIYGLISYMYLKEIVLKKFKNG